MPIFRGFINDFKQAAELKVGGAVPPKPPPSSPQTKTTRGGEGRRGALKEQFITVLPVLT